MFYNLMGVRFEHFDQVKKTLSKFMHAAYFIRIRFHFDLKNKYFR